MMRYVHDRNWGCRIHEMIFRGLRVVILENDLLRVTVLADKGTDIYELLYKPKDIDFMWRSPFPLRNPALFVPTFANAAGAFHDNYPGGWQEILPTGGVPTNYKGAEFGYHGEVSLISWDYTIMEDRPERIEVLFKTRTYRTPFYVEKRLSLEIGKCVLGCHERLINEGEEPMQLMWGHHPALGQNFVDSSCQVDLPGATVMTRRLGETSRLVDGDGYIWPWVVGKDGQAVDLHQVPPMETRSHDVAFLYDLTDSWYAIRNRNKKLGFGMRWDGHIWPYLWFWQVYGGAYGYNLYGRSYHLALEPWSSIPDSFEKAADRGTLLQLAPGQEVTSSLVAVVFEGDGPVIGIDTNGSTHMAST
jgi:galactose mutarotase-like enzyme